MSKLLLDSTAISGTTKITTARVVVRKGGGVSFQLWTDGTVDGSWVIRASNLPGADVAGDAKAADITAAFKGPDGGAVATVAHGSAATQQQAVQAFPIYAAVLWAEFTPSGGAGNVGCNYNEVEQV